PYAQKVQVVTWGMDPNRFPWPSSANLPSRGKQRLRLLMAGLVDEMIKGFRVLHEACAILWETRNDFELLVTADPAGPIDSFTRYIGWLSQDQLPEVMRQADIVVMPTIAQEGLGRSTVEAMGAGKPVIASRIGGLPYTVTDES